MKRNIMDYGAADGAGVCTEAIQRAIDLCEMGDEVLIPKGCFVTGALFLKSNMTLYLEEGARLVGSGRLEDFPLMGYPFEGLDQLCYASLLNTDGAPHENICIDGKGVIDANGAKLFALEMEEGRGKRGRAVCIRNTTNVVIRGVTIRQSPAWCLHLIYCQNVWIDHIQVHTKYDENGNRYEGIFNGDGIDVDSCRNVVIRNSLIASQDDCIAIKSGRDAEGRRAGIPSEQIVIENCVFKSGFGVAMGSEMSGGVRDVSVRDCRFENAYSIASIKAVRGRGSYIRDIRYENCSLVNHDEELHDTKWFRGAIYMDGFYGCEDFDADTPEPVDEKTPIVERISFRNITLDTLGGNAVYLCGLPEMPFKDVVMENVTGRGIHGMTVKNIQGLQQKNVKVSGIEDKGLRPLDYGIRSIETMMRKFKAQDLPPKGRFHYHQGVFLSGVYQVYQLYREEDPAAEKYFDYLKAWVDSCVNEQGGINKYDQGQLDDIQPGILLFPLYERTQDERYKKALEELMGVLKDFPKIPAGGYYHKKHYPEQMWLDGLYMAGPISAMYAERFDHPEFLKTAYEQVMLMKKNTLDEKTGLWYHAYDDARKEPWADKETGRSPEFWGRSIGWVPVAVLDELDHISRESAYYEELSQVVRELLQAVCKYQADSGLWYQVVDKAGQEGNWPEISCSCLYVAAICKAVRLGILSDDYLAIARRGYAAVIDSLQWEGEDLLLGGVCVGTGVGDYAHYCGRPTSTNDLHGVGAFLIMCAQVQQV